MILLFFFFTVKINSTNLYYLKGTSMYFAIFKSVIEHTHGFFASLIKIKMRSFSNEHTEHFFTAMYLLQPLLLHIVLQIPHGASELVSRNALITAASSSKICKMKREVLCLIHVLTQVLNRELFVEGWYFPHCKSIQQSWQHQAPVHRVLNAAMSVSCAQSQNQFTPGLAEDVIPSCQVLVSILKQRLSNHLQN